MPCSILSLICDMLQADMQTNCFVSAAADFFECLGVYC